MDDEKTKVIGLLCTRSNNYGNFFDDEIRIIFMLHYNLEQDIEK